MKILRSPKYENLWFRERGLSYFRKGYTIMDHMEFIWIIAFDYATIIYGQAVYGSEIMGRFQEIKTKVKLKTNRFEIKF